MYTLSMHALRVFMHQYVLLLLQINQSITQIKREKIDIRREKKILGEILKDIEKKKDL